MTNFFTTLEPVTDEVELQLTIKSKAGIMSVLVMPKAAVKDLKPLHLSGTPAELDAEFETAFMRPLSKTAGVISNAAEYEASMNKRIIASAAGAKAPDKPVDQKEAERLKKDADRIKKESDQLNKYDALIKSAEKATEGKDYKKAIELFNQAMPLTGQKENVSRAIAKVKELASAGGLFEGMADDEPEAEVTVESSNTTEPQVPGGGINEDDDLEEGEPNDD